MKKADLLIISLLVLIVFVSQFILAKKHLQFGFFTDDWLFLSAYRAYVSNPVLDILTAWKAIGSHNFSYVYYQGILFNFFGLDYSAYRLVNLILKIIATLSLYPLVLHISKHRLFAFVATVIYAIHYSPFGLLDGASRGGNFIAIALMNLFLLVYFYITKKKIFNIFLLVGLAVLLFTTIFFSTTRLFPLLLIVPAVEVLNFIQEKKGSQIILSLKRLSVLYSPLIFLFIFSPESIAQQLRYSIGLFDKLRDGNWQLLLTPFASFGSTYIPREYWFLFDKPSYHDLSSYLAFLIQGPLFLFYLFYILIGFFISKKPLKFIARSLVFNFIAGIFVFLIVHNWLFLNEKIRAPVDPGTFLVPALIGLFILTASFALFLEWRQSQIKSNLLPVLFVTPIFSLIFIFLTWIFADINSIFMGVHAYLNIPAIGTSVALASILVIIYERLKRIKIFGAVSIFLVVVILGFYFTMSAKVTDSYFSYWLNNGLRANDQQRVMDQFWTEVGYSKNYNTENLPLIYLDTSEDYSNGGFYSETIIWRLASWFDLKFKNNKEGRFSLCDLMILDKSELENSVSVINGERRFVRYKCNKDGVIYKTENFFAFKLIDRNLIPNRVAVLNQLGLK